MSAPPPGHGGWQPWNYLGFQPCNDAASPPPPTNVAEKLSWTEHELDRLLLLSDSEAWMLSDDESELQIDATRSQLLDTKLQKMPHFDAKRARKIALANRRRMVYRTKKKKELDELIMTAEVLEKQLAELHQRNEALKNELQNCGRETQCAVGWRGVALRQQQQLMDAMYENQELRDLVQQQQVVTHQLIGDVRSAFSSVDYSKIAGLLQCHHKEIVRVNSTDTTIATELVAQIDATYSDVDQVLRDWPPPSDPPHGYVSSQDWKTHPDEGYAYYETRETWVIPFSLEVAVSAMMKAPPFMFAKECVPTEIPLRNSASDSVALKTVLTFSDSQQQRHLFDTVFVIKVYKEDDRAVFGWRYAYKERGGPLKTFHESGWGLASNENAEIIGCDQQFGATRISLCSRMRSHGLSLCGTPEKQLESFIQAVASKTQTSILEWSRAIESIVMQNTAVLQELTPKRK